MNACLYVGYQNNEWVWDIFPGKSPAEMPIVGKSWARHAVDLCSLLKVSDIYIADCFFYPELTKRLGDGSFWSTRLHHLPCTDALNPARLFEQYADRPVDERIPDDEELLIFWGQVLPDLPDIDRLFDELEPVEIPPDEALPAGIYLKKDGKLHRCVCPLHRMDTPKSYFDLNLLMLNHPGIYNLPGFSEEKGFCIGANVITLPGCDLTPPLVIQDNSALGRSTVLAGNVIVGSQVLIDDYTRLKRAVILNNTYIGRNMQIEDKIISERTVIDVNTGAHVELSDDFLLGHTRRRKVDRFVVTEFIVALLLLVWLLPSWLLALALRKWLSKLPYFKYVLQIYPKLPRVLAGRASLVRNGLRDNDYVFRFSDQWIRVHDESYRNFSDVYFSTHRTIRYTLAVVVASLVKRFFTLSEPKRGGAPRR